MSQPAAATADAPPVSVDAFTTDRANMWAGFCRFTTFGAVAVGVLVVLMALFLL